MSQREILTNGNAFKRTDGRWGGTVWYLDEKGERKRKSFSGTTKSEVNQKMKKYILEFNQQKNDSVESLKTACRIGYRCSSSLPWSVRPMTERRASRKIKSILDSARRLSATSPPQISKSCSIIG